MRKRLTPVLDRDTILHTHAHTTRTNSFRLKKSKRHNDRDTRIRNIIVTAVRPAVKFAQLTAVIRENDFPRNFPSFRPVTVKGKRDN